MSTTHFSKLYQYLCLLFNPFIFPSGHQSYYQLVIIMIWMIFAFLLAAVLAQQCPSSVKNELELISLPLKCFHQLYDSSTHDGHKISRVINERLEVYRRMLQEIRMQDWQHLRTTPVLKWAQSEAQIFVSFKLSHRQDSPTCSDIRSESFETSEVNVTEGDLPFELHNNAENNFSVFRYRGECLFTNEKFLFTLALQFESFLSKVMLRKQGLGLYTLVGDKAEKGIWAKPFNDFKKGAIWPELRQKYSGDMDKFFDMMESSESSSKKRRRRRPKGDTQAEQKHGEKAEQKEDEL